MKWFVFLLLFIIVFLLSSTPIFAIVDPLASPNNYFGIHIIDQNDLDDAERLVNSSGGSWGYVVFVISEKERDPGKWQNIFNEARRKKLIPLVRLATEIENGQWKKPKKEDAFIWADFLNKLNWVVKNRYIILFNEPNHAKEWGGEINPEEYGEIIKAFSSELKNKSEDFFILPAGLDASSINTKESMEISLFLGRLIKSRPDFFSFIDGWTSHSYPNPNFSASPAKTGKGSIQSWFWEISSLKKLGLAKSLPIFITETGWAHEEGEENDYSFLPSSQTANLFKFAFENIWQEANLVLVAPFLLNYQSLPFDHFSWKKIRSNDFYPQYFTIQNLPKTKGEPVQDDNAAILSADLPDKLVNFSDYQFKVELLNNGQSIWDRSDNFHLNLKADPLLANVFIDELNNIEPFQRTKVNIRVKTPKTEDATKITIQMQKDDLSFGDLWQKEITIVPPPKLTIKANFWFGKSKQSKSARLLIYDENLLLKEFSNLTIKDGEGEILEVRDLIPNKNYRFVLLSPYYLPSQTYSPFWEGKTIVIFKRMLPFDLNSDGKWSLEDLLSALKNPKQTFSLLLPF